MDTLELPTMLTLSTVHLSPETCKKMDEWCGTIDLKRIRYSEAPTLLGATDYGWFMYARDERDDSNDIPDDLWACMEFARKNNANYLLFDRDGDELEGLPNLGGPN